MRRRSVSPSTGSGGAGKTGASCFSWAAVCLRWRARRPRHLLRRFAFSSRALSAVRRQLAEKAVVVEEEPELKPWGLLEMVVRDPDGLALVFVEVPVDHPLRRRS